MPYYQLSDKISFPHPSLADEDGLLAFGGDLSPERLLFAYQCGIFPWYNDGEPILWWSPDPRFVLFPEKLKVSKTMRQVLRREHFNITFDTAFEEVIRACADIPRHDQGGTWITTDMHNAYVALHKLGFAHSVEAWQDDVLVGGLYGISLGNAFFGESMFAKVSNASKAAFITMVKTLEAKGFSLIDCQTPTAHLGTLGAEEIDRDDFLSLLQACLEKDTLRGNWAELL